MAETSGLVQHMKWAPGSRAVFVYIGPAMTATRLFIILFDTNDVIELAFRRAAAQLLAKARSAGLAVRLQHDNNSTITGVDTWISALRVGAIEVTQAIQNLYHSVTLVALKTTVTRVYLSARSGPPVTVRGQLRVRRPPGVPVTIASLNDVLLDSTQVETIAAQRNDAQRSLNFLLPIGQIAAGALEVELAGVEDVATSVSLDPGPTSPVSVSFVASPPLRLRVLGISYQQGTPPQTHIPTALDFGLVTSWLQRAYPVYQVLSSQAIVAATPPPPFNCGQINAQVAAIRALDVSAGADNRTHYYGLVSDGGFFMRGCAAVPGAPDPTAIGSGPTGPATWGWDFDGSYGDWYTGHELGHTLGRKHPGFCGETHDDPAYPFPAGQLADADNAFVGFDVGDAVFGLPMTALPGTAWHDVMTYCNRQWLSSYTYQGIRTRLVAEDALGAGAGAGGGSGRPDERFPAQAKSKRVTTQLRSLLSVVATVNVTQRSGTIDYVNPVQRGTVTPPDRGSPVAILVKDAGGKVLYEARVAVKPLSDTVEGEDEHGLVDAIVAAGPDARSLELVIGAKVVDRYGASDHPPRVHNVRSVAPANKAPALAWDTDATGDDRHTYSVQVSADNGRTWQTVAVGFTSTSIPIDYAQFGGGKELLVRLIATDGFRRFETTTALAVGETPSR